MRYHFFFTELRKFFFAVAPPFLFFVLFTVLYELFFDHIVFDASRPLEKIMLVLLECVKFVLYDLMYLIFVCHIHREPFS